jgi:hypothetical protein
MRQKNTSITSPLLARFTDLFWSQPAATRIEEDAGEKSIAQMKPFPKIPHSLRPAHPPPARFFLKSWIAKFAAR